jgi:hypothetical protein
MLVPYSLRIVVEPSLYRAWLLIVPFLREFPAINPVFTIPSLEWAADIIYRTWGQQQIAFAPEVFLFQL